MRKPLILQAFYLQADSCLNLLRDLKNDNKLMLAEILPILKSTQHMMSHNLSHVCLVLEINRKLLITNTDSSVQRAV